MISQSVITSRDTLVKYTCCDVRQWSYVTSTHWTSEVFLRRLTDCLMICDYNHHCSEYRAQLTWCSWVAQELADESVLCADCREHAGEPKRPRI